MNIKIGKFEANFPAWAFVLAALLADNMYANHCNSKKYQACIDANRNEDNSEDEEDEEP